MVTLNPKVRLDINKWICHPSETWPKKFGCQQKDQKTSSKSSQESTSRFAHDLPHSDGFSLNESKWPMNNYEKLWGALGRWSKTGSKTSSRRRQGFEIPSCQLHVLKESLLDFSAWWSARCARTLLQGFPQHLTHSSSFWIPDLEKTESSWIIPILEGVLVLKQLKNCSASMTTSAFKETPK